MITVVPKEMPAGRFLSLDLTNKDVCNLLAHIMWMRNQIKPAAVFFEIEMTPDEARREANKLMASEAYTTRDHPDHASTVEHVQHLFEHAYPEA